mmetsp:Transcript_38110/g.61701  ORF Transcript_38110/g.61701 Transcript_38110/m.61701 type:complete len:515 (+) Transcript_38110:172-1716(+)|eukprot:CAMPEP_0184674694 /NCGR_PEP_ID=MMETSP0308-20130426/87382_1 /TAXON_ID=38269 /ORGANISM="Gloeochaete witrockiana, Strain SAG 46.84" /LENGTH=514 /DNA_ID=CAMNT_0027122331 /DNA_START=86 /DNA_END=1630 /DNA_ORIENTATION=+
MSGKTAELMAAPYRSLEESHVDQISVENAQTAEKATSKCCRFLGPFATLKGAPKELFIIYLLKILESYAYFAQSFILVIFLSEEFGFSDAHAAWIYSLSGLSIGVLSFFVGFIVDNLGVRATLIIGMACVTVARVIIAFSHSSIVIIVTLLSLQSFGTSLGIPVMTIGIRRYTNSTNRTPAFSLFYIVMNVAALLAGVAVDGFRYGYGVTNNEEGSLEAPMPTRVTLGTPFRAILLSAAVANLVAFLVSLVGIREISVNESGTVEAFAPVRGLPWAIAREILTSSRFWRFILFILLLIGVRLVLRHLDLTLPKYLLREVSADAPYGSIIALNPLLLILLIPFLTAFYQTRVHAFDAILVGSFVSAFSPFFMLAGPYYWNAICFVIVLSIGEAIYSPRLYEYATTVAPVGREGTYAALSTLPMFGAKLGTGVLSGYMLEGFCPATGHRQCWIMWLIISLTALSSPVLMLLLKGVIKQTFDDDVEKKPPPPPVKEGEEELAPVSGSNLIPAVVLKA